MIDIVEAIIYVLFILAINRLSSPYNAYKGNILAIFAMILSLFLGFYELEGLNVLLAFLAILIGSGIGVFMGYEISMPNLPQLIALLNGFGGLAATFISIAEITNKNQLFLLFIIAIGALTFSGSLAAFFKLSNMIPRITGRVLRSICFVMLIFSIISSLYANNGDFYFVIAFLIFVSLFGFFFILPIGGADMPIIISILNSLSGWCTVLVGLSLNNTLLIVVGTLVGSSGLILTFIMTKAMNRSFFKVLFQPVVLKHNESIEDRPVIQGTPEDAAFLLENARKVIVVPGYGMASSGAQVELVNMVKILKQKYGVDVKYAIHPVAGRMPGHMNVLLAEADADSDDVFELKDINQDFQTVDVVYVIGANDITNPLAKTDEDSPIYQMPILEVEQAKKILFVKRSMATGYSGIDNPLFYSENTIMLFGDAKEITKAIVSDLLQD